jgi:hypothetical protein
LLTLAKLLASILTPYLEANFNQLEGMIMGIQDDVNELTDQVKKGTQEVLDKIDELEAANPDVDLSGLKAAAQALDDVVADTDEDDEPHPDQTLPGDL